MSADTQWGNWSLEEEVWWTQDPSWTRFIRINRSGDKWEWNFEWLWDEGDGYALLSYASSRLENTLGEAKEVSKTRGTQLYRLMESCTFVVSPSDITGAWDSHCLEVDIASSGEPGKGPTDALKRCMSATALFIISLLEEGRDPFAHKAPPEYWPPERFKTGALHIAEEPT